MAEQSGHRLFECRECGVKYADEVWARRCREWCAEHNSCNIEIIQHRSLEGE